MAFSVQKASAGDDWNNSWLKQRFNPVNATLELDIRVYQDWGGSNQGHCGFCDKGYLDVDVAGMKIKIDGSGKNGRNLMMVKLPESISRILNGWANCTMRIIIISQYFM